MGATKTLYFPPKELQALLDKLNLGGLWKAKPGDNLLIICIAEPVSDPVGDYHRGKGCCDGTDPSDCYRRQEEARQAAEKAEKEAKRKKRENPRDEFEGTD